MRPIDLIEYMKTHYVGYFWVVDRNGEGVPSIVRVHATNSHPIVEEWHGRLRTPYEYGDVEFIPIDYPEVNHGSSGEE